ncbi:hypothetical protein BDV18DRAFT_155423 [Aspergillus unguis]
MTATGQLWDNQHGVSGYVEAGKGRITRYSDGQTTRFTFKEPFSQTPNVQITPILPGGPEKPFHTFYLYLLSSTGASPVDKNGFELGIFSEAGETIEFEYFATDIYEE